MAAFIALEGFTLPSGFICKELCIIHPNNEFDHYLLKMPGLQLTEADRKTIRYTTQVINKLSYQDGKVPYEHILNLLDPVKDIVIYTFSDVAVRFLQMYLPTTVIKNIQNDGYVMPNNLPDSNCFRNHCSRYCAKSKARAIKQFLQNCIRYA